jgi:hypothetical protein
MDGAIGPGLLSSWTSKTSDFDGGQLLARETFSVDSYRTAVRPKRPVARYPASDRKESLTCGYQHIEFDGILMCDTETISLCLLEREHDDWKSVCRLPIGD